MIYFETPGSIDLRAFTLLGASHKRSDSPIGMFGTGLKYALAVLMRTGQQVTVHTEGRNIEITTKRVLLNNEKPFDVICIDGKETSITTELGKFWKLWMAYRELYSNTIDEAGQINHKLSGQHDSYIAVSGEAFEDVHRNRDQFLIGSRNPLAETEHANIFGGGKPHIFYRGIKVGEWEGAYPLFMYDIKDKVGLTEDRTLKYTFTAKTAARRAVEECQDDFIITAAIKASDVTLEHSFEWQYANKHNEFFARIVERELEHNYTKVNEKLRRLFRPKSELDELNTRPLSSIEQKQLDRAVKFCKDLNFPADAYPVVLSTSLPNDTFGLALEGTIVLGARTFEAGTAQLAVTLIEEFTHLRHDIADFTREFQEKLLHEIVRLGQEHVWKEPL